MSLLKRLGGAPQPNDSGPAASPPSAPPENGALRGGGGITAPPPLPPEAMPRSAPIEQREAQPAQGGGLSAALGFGTTNGGDVSMGTTDQRVLELSLWIVDRIQGSMGNQTELKRTPEAQPVVAMPESEPATENKRWWSLPWQR